MGFLWGESTDAGASWWLCSKNKLTWRNKTKTATWEKQSNASRGKKRTGETWETEYCDPRERPSHADVTQSWSSDDCFWNWLVGEVYWRQKWCKFTECNLQRSCFFLFFFYLLCFFFFSRQEMKKGTFCMFVFFLVVGNVTLIYFGLFSEDTVSLAQHETTWMDKRWTGYVRWWLEGVFFALKIDFFCSVPFGGLEDWTWDFKGPILLQFYLFYFFLTFRILSFGQDNRAGVLLKLTVGNSWKFVSNTWLFSVVSNVCRCPLWHHRGTRAQTGDASGATCSITRDL